MWFSDLDRDEKISQLQHIKQLAKTQQWPRIERWATSILFQVLHTNGFHLSAILEIQDIIDHAPHVQQMETMYDYPLIGIYMDMARALYWLGDAAGAFEYCQKYTNYIAQDLQVREEGLTCQITTALKQKKYAEALSLLQELATLANSTKRPQSRITVLLQTALVYREQKNFELADQYARQALQLLEATPAPLPGQYYTAYLSLTAAQVGLQNPQLAQMYFAKMQQARNETLQGLRFDMDALLGQARIAWLNQDFTTAQQHYEALIELYQTQRSQSFSSAHLAQIQQQLDTRQLAYLQVEAKLHQTQSEKMTLIAIFSTLFAMVVSIFLWRLVKQKKQLDNFARIDSLTSVNNRWHALELIHKRLKAMNREDDRVCVALLDIDNFKQFNDSFGHQTGDAVLALFAKLCKYQFRQDDVFGRYGGEEFVLLLNQSSLDLAQTKIDELRTIIAGQDLREHKAEGTLRFSCGLVEITQKSEVSQVLAHCDHLLYLAKRQGRNQTVTGYFGQLI
ncbi:GGDEF domain-containing protein [Salinimonas marina]|uniref:diguanylate cyclase n=1 Tax=Salinimonas marina TaxID=2785918 RepID=A0A7S9DXW1_9ALTE|nr:tetratricopeptide repeat-containing diguanylate cyclase [Salinimonas marina]QPG05880.1 GGDEF domain-containing protein [Salinimonas marina]